MRKNVNDMQSAFAQKLNVSASLNRMSFGNLC